MGIEISDSTGKTQYLELIQGLRGPELRVNNEDSVTYITIGDQIEITLDDQQIEKRKLKICVQIISLEEEFKDDS